MTWSITRRGKAAEIRPQVAQDAQDLPPLGETEQHLKEAAIELALHALDVQAPGNHMVVELSGGSVAHAPIEGKDPVEKHSVRVQIIAG
jgi:hypothetical protein